MQSFDAGQLPQDCETLPLRARRGRFGWRYAYARAADTAATGECGQDYLAWRVGERTFAFALCDGVGQSFFGELAARFLGDALVTWLWESLPVMLPAAVISATLTTHLRQLTVPASALVEVWPLSAAAPSLLRDVLEQKRARGSESTFVGGRLDLPSPDAPAGRLVLAWLGDSRLRLWAPDGERTADLGETFLTRQRWSTQRGPIDGQPHVFVAPLVADGCLCLSRLLAYSDGLAALDEFPGPPSDDALRDLISQAHGSIASDDIAFLDVWPWPGGQAEPELPRRAVTQ
jgi:hypothetical protein